MKQVEHPVLGVFEGDLGEWSAREPLTLRCTGQRTDSVIIATAPGAESPSDEQFRALLDLVTAPESFREVMTDAIYKAYSGEICVNYRLPEIEPDGVWQLITGLYGIWVLEDASVSADFSNCYDEEHQIHVLVKDGVIDLVWLE